MEHVPQWIIAKIFQYQRQTPRNLTFNLFHLEVYTARIADAAESKLADHNPKSWL
jgi:hypothetical protein